VTHDRNLIDGTGGCWPAEALTEATRAREAAEADGALTWSHLLTEKLAVVMTKTDRGELLDSLTALQEVVEDWREVLVKRIVGTVHGPRCLCLKCNPDATNTHNCNVSVN
jgi:hypothetical protein